MNREGEYLSSVLHVDQKIWTHGYINLIKENPDIRAKSAVDWRSNLVLVKHFERDFIGACHYAAERGYLDIVKYTFSACNEMERNALLYNSTSANRLNVVKFLLDHDVKPDAYTLEVACQTNNYAAIKLILKGQPDLTQELNNFGEWWDDNIHLLKYLYRYGTGLSTENSQDILDTTGELEVIKILVNNNQGMEFDTVLSNSIIHEKFDIINYILDEQSEWINNLQQSSYFAITSGQIDTLERLIQLGAEPDETMIIDACGSGNLNMVKLLVEKYNLIPNENCVQITIKQNNYDMLEYILEHGAPVIVPNEMADGISTKIIYDHTQPPIVPPSIEMARQGRTEDFIQLLQTSTFDQILLYAQYPSPQQKFLISHLIDRTFNLIRPKWKQIIAELISMLRDEKIYFRTLSIIQRHHNNIFLIYKELSKYGLSPKFPYLGANSELLYQFQNISGVDQSFNDGMRYYLVAIASLPVRDQMYSHIKNKFRHTNADFIDLYNYLVQLG